MSAHAAPSLPPPPESHAAALAWLRLTRSRRVGPQTFLRLMSTARGAEEAFANLPAMAAGAGAKDYRPCARDQALAELEAGKAAGARLVFLGHRDYPARLAQIPDPPPVLWVKGRQDVLEARAVALVGARNASSLGLRMAKRMGDELGAAGLIVVSGLARGIDTAAQKAALQTGTVAVLAGGIDVIYPQENTELARRIAAEGALISEHPPGLVPQARHFPRRNRLISGLAEGVVVLEGALKSGSLITARDALDQGREVMAVPGHPVDARAGGCNALIRDGAVLVRGAEDVLSALGRGSVAKPVPKPTPCTPPTPQPQGEIAHHVLNLIGPTPVPEDALIRTLDAPPGAVLRALTELELAGQVERHPGGAVSRSAAL